uniref:NADH-ubiquinone oxidoreductase chain 4 n=1 Tax=Heliopora coerulea TaxID=86515 RepID=M1KXY6_9CNID|nr:NADH dehydrogenase subunit 4 [Heliopora coerulea]AGF33132.1 NADH dehydrogenase subunit 4 [Heliopora coerulea]UKP87689.1 NADH dehydrogenase subunit 4 [Heliopora coerulea]
MILTCIVGSILISIIIIALIPRENSMKLRQQALEWSLITFALSILLLVNFHQEAQFQQIIEFSWVSTIGWFEGSPILFAIDGISIFFIILSTLLTPICILVSWDSIKFLVKEFIMCLLGIELLLIGVFSTLDLLIFYVLFESILIPMFLIIGVWGARAEKIKAAYYFFFYTLVGSILMLLSIAVIYRITGTTDYLSLTNIQIGIDGNTSIQIWLFIGFFLSLAVKIPMIPFHIWLPLAHVEAPLAGSVILAGILLKLGGYGFIRFAWPIFPEATEYLAPIILTLSLIAVIYGSLTTCRQVDAKRLIAYSSVAHMGIVTIGLFTHTMEGLIASIFLMIAHGVVSPALFIAVTLLYERHHTRLVRYYRGVVMTMPLFSIVFMVFTLANIAVPLSCNFVGEFLSLVAAFSTSTSLGVLTSTSMVIAAAYSLYLYNRICFGQLSPYLIFSRDINRREFNGQFPLIVAILLLGIVPYPLIELVRVCLPRFL